MVESIETAAPARIQDAYTPEASNKESEARTVSLPQFLFESTYANGSGGVARHPGCNPSDKDGPPKPKPKEKPDDCCPDDKPVPVEPKEKPDCCPHDGPAKPTDSVVQPGSSVGSDDEPAAVTKYLSKYRKAPEERVKPVVDDITPPRPVAPPQPGPDQPPGPGPGPRPPRPRPPGPGPRPPGPRPGPDDLDPPPQPYQPGKIDAIDIAPRPAPEIYPEPRPNPDVNPGPRPGPQPGPAPRPKPG